MSRKVFLNRMLQMAVPVLDAAADGELRRKINVEQRQGMRRERFAGLEAVGRLLCGMAPWFEAEITEPSERELRNDLLQKAIKAIDGQVNPSSEDFIDHQSHIEPFSQMLVDTALLAQALLRAPSALLEALPADTKGNLVKLLEAARKVAPCISNWVLFSTEVEILYRKLTGKSNDNMVRSYFNLIDSWYFGDGWYGDGPHFATDYYNSLIIHPMMLDICDFAPEILHKDSIEKILPRAQRHAEVLENLVAPDGTYIATGRSLTYRCGVFHLLAQLTWQRRLPKSVSPATAREVLYAVTEKTLTPASYREDGFLNIGICRHQPEFGEFYICTGSLYLASAAFLLLGISADDEFWSLPAQPWKQRAVWEGR